MFPAIYQKLLWRLARRFIPGKYTADGLYVAQDLNRLRLHAILDHLGEEVTTREGIDGAVAAYEELIEGIVAAGGLIEKNPRIRTTGIDASLKFSHFGLGSSHAVRQFIYRSDFSDLFYVINLMNFKRIHPWLDAERLGMRDPQWQFVRHLLLVQKLPFLGVAFQAYGAGPYDSMEFFDTAIVPLLCQIPSQCTLGIRLCPGAYRSEDFVIKNKRELHIRYCDLLGCFFEQIAVFLESGRRVPFFLECASHNEARVEAALHFAKEYGVPEEYYRIAFLYGRRQSLASHMVTQGVNVAVYIPIGESVIPYVFRRVRENPQCIFLPFKNEGRYHDCVTWPDECSLYSF